MKLYLRHAHHPASAVNTLLAIVEPMFGRQDMSPEESKLFNLLVKLIQDYEDKHHPIDDSAIRNCAPAQSTILSYMPGTPRSGLAVGRVSSPTVREGSG
jgi:hypothetical protein